MAISDEAAKIVTAGAKIATSCGTTLWGVVTLHNAAVLLAATFSALQIYVLVRDQILHRRKRSPYRGGRE